MKRSFLLIITVAILQIFASFCINAGEIVELLDHTRDSYWQRLTRDNLAKLNQNQLQQIDNFFNRMPTNIKLNYHLGGTNGRTNFLEILFKGKAEYDEVQSNDLINNIETDFPFNIIPVDKTFNQNCPIIIGVIRSLITPLVQRLKDEQKNTTEAIKQNFVPRFFFCLALFESTLFRMKNETFKKEEDFNERKNLFQNFAGNFLDSELENQPDQVKIYKEYFVDHITFGLQYFDRYIQNNKNSVKDPITFNNRINELIQIFVKDKKNFNDLNDWYFFEKSFEEIGQNKPKIEIIELSSKKTITESQQQTPEANIKAPKKEKKQPYKNIQPNDSEDTKVDIPRQNDPTPLTIPYDPSDYRYVDYIVNEQPYLKDMDPEEFEKYGFKFNDNPQQNESFIEITNSNFNSYETLVNQKITNPLLSPNILIFKEILKYYYQKVQKEQDKRRGPLYFLMLETKDDLWRAICMLNEIDLLFNKYTTEEEFGQLCDKIKEDFKNNNSKYLENIKEYAQELALACKTQSELSNDKELQKRIKEINKEIPALELLSKIKQASKAQPKKSYFYHWLIGGSIGIAALLGFLHKKNVINIPFFNRIPYLKK